MKSLVQEYDLFDSYLKDKIELTFEYTLNEIYIDTIYVKIKEPYKYCNLKQCLYVNFID